MITENVCARRRSHQQHQAQAPANSALGRLHTCTSRRILGCAPMRAHLAPALTQKPTCTKWVVNKCPIAS